jgi:hypothetical protein
MFHKEDKETAATPENRVFILPAPAGVKAAPDAHKIHPSCTQKMNF